MTAIEIKTINLWEDHFIMKNSGGVNCYLVRSDSGFILIDSGFQSKRDELVPILEEAGCRSGTLKLILITHGDVDHIGNCAFLREKFGAKIATHKNETVAVQQGDMAANRKNKPGTVGKLVLALVGWLNRRNQFEPDFFVEDGFNLSQYGLPATVIHTPGHSLGSIGILIESEQVLFCGDLLWNVSKPEPQPNGDDPAVIHASLEKLHDLPFQTVYPGHGKPFPKSAFWG